MKKKTLVWGMLALGAMLVGGQLAAKACDGKGRGGPTPTAPVPDPTPSGE